MYIKKNTYFKEKYSIVSLKSYIVNYVVQSKKKIRKTTISITRNRFPLFRSWSITIPARGETRLSFCSIQRVWIDISKPFVIIRLRSNCKLWRIHVCVESVCGNGYNWKESVCRFRSRTHQLHVLCVIYLRLDRTYLDFVIG